jgi:hypothetical protein
MTYTVPPGRYSDTSADFIQAYIDQSIQDLVGASPESLDTLQELADALGDNPDAINNLIADLQAEIDRAVAAEAAITQAINDEANTSASYDIQQDNRMSVLEIVNEISKKELSYITLIGSASPAPGQVGVNSFAPSGISMIVLPKTDNDGKTVTSSDFLEGDRIGLKQNNGSAGIFFVEDAFDFGDHIRINVDDSSTVLGAAGDLAFIENDPVEAVFEDTSVTRAAATAGFTAASDARAVLQGLIDALEARADVLEADPTTATDVAAGDAATLASANTYTDTSITNLVNGADAALDTLKEIGDALAQGDTDVTAALTTQITTEATTRGNADTALSGRLDVLEADPTTQTAVDAKLNTANPAATGELTVDTNAKLEFDSNLTKLHNVLRSTSIVIGNNITLNPAAADGRVEIEGEFYLRPSDLTDAADDTAAAAAGIIVGQVYRNGSQLMVRVS